jgi:hypothetical protein
VLSRTGLLRKSNRELLARADKYERARYLLDHQNYDQWASGDRQVLNEAIALLTDSQGETTGSSTARYSLTYVRRDGVFGKISVQPGGRYVFWFGQNGVTSIYDTGGTREPYHHGLEDKAPELTRSYVLMTDYRRRFLASRQPY